MKNKLYNYNIGHKPFPHILGGALETTDEGDYIYDENDDDDNVYLPTGKSYGDWYERDGNDFTMHNRFGNDYVMHYNPDTKTFSYDPPEGETMDIINVKHEQLPYLEYDEDDEDFIKVDKIRKTVEETMADIDKLNYQEQLHELQTTIDALGKIMLHNQKIMDEMKIQLDKMSQEIFTDQKRTVIKMKLEETKNPEKLKHDIIQNEKLMDNMSKSITPLNYENPKFIKKGIEMINDISKEQKLYMFSLVNQKALTTKNEKQQAKLKFLALTLLDSIYPLYNNLDNIKNERNKDLMETRGLYQDVVAKFEKFKKSYNKDLVQTTKKESQKSVEEQRNISKSVYEKKLEKEIEERKKKQAEEAKLAPQIEPVEAPISKAKDKKNKSKDKKSAEDKEFEVIKNYANDRIKRIDSEYTGEGKPLETFFTELGEPIIQHVTHDNSKVYDNELNDKIPDEMVTFDNGQTGSLKQACTIDLYSTKSAIEIKNYKQYNINTGDKEGNTDNTGEPSIPLQFSKYEGTKYFRPLYFSDGTLWNIELVRYKGAKEISRDNILPDNPEGRNLFTIYRLDDGLYKFDPKEHKNITMKYRPIKGFTTPQGVQLYAFDSMNLNPCQDHNGRSSFNVIKYLKKIKI